MPSASAPAQLGSAPPHVSSEVTRLPRSTPDPPDPRSTTGTPCTFRAVRTPGAPPLVKQDGSPVDGNYGRLHGRNGRFFVWNGWLYPVTFDYKDQRCVADRFHGKTQI